MSSANKITENQISIALNSICKANNKIQAGHLVKTCLDKMTAVNNDFKNLYSDFKIDLIGDPLAINSKQVVYVILRNLSLQTFKKDVHCYELYLGNKSELLYPSKILTIFQSTIAKCNLQISSNSYSKIILQSLENYETKLFFIPIFRHGSQFFCPSSYFLKEDTYWCEIDLDAPGRLVTFGPCSNQMYKIILRCVQLQRVFNAHDFGIALSFMKLLRAGKYRDSHLWEKSKMAKIFVTFLELFNQSVSDKKLEHYNLRGLNCFHGMESNKQALIQKSFSSLVNILTKDPSSLKSYLGDQTTLPQLLTSQNNLKSSITPANTSQYPSLGDLKDILKVKIKINEDEKTFHLKIVNKLLGFLKKEAKRLEFHNIQDIGHTGSYYENLRVGEATEFDFNIILKFPFKFEKVSFEKADRKSESVFIKCRLTDDFENCYKKSECYKPFKEIYRKFVNKQGYFMASRVRAWFQGVIDKMDLTNRTVMKKCIPEIENLSFSQSGPARTLFIKTVRNVQIDFDLVPVFEFEFNKKGNPLGCQYPVNVTFKDLDKNWLLVPKPYKGPCKDDLDLLWRQHTASAEKKILQGKECAKPVIKLMKLLRDEQRCDKIASYYIKNIAYQKVAQNYSDPNYWKESNMPRVLMEMLQLLLKSLQDKRLPSFFFPKYNIFSAIQDSVLENYYNQLARVIKMLPDDPKDVFNCKIP